MGLIWLFEAGDFFGRQFDGKGCDGVFKMMGLGRANYRRGDHGLVKQPG